MSKQTYYYVVSGVFLIVGVMHLVRVMNQWPAYIAGVEIPLWVSWVAVALTGYLAVRGFQYGRKL